MNLKSTLKVNLKAGCWQLTPIILANWEAEVMKIVVQGQPRQVVHKTPISKISRAE
jgi:hypothetical protein